MHDYRRYMILSCVGMAATIAAALEYARVSAPLCTLIGTWGALCLGHSIDSVSQHFKTDVDRILQPNEELKAAIVVHVVIGGSVVIVLVGKLLPPMIGAPMATMMLIAFMYHFFR